MASSGNRYGGTGTPTGAGALSAARAITQSAAGVPTHVAPKNTLYFNEATGLLYINTDGGTTWTATGDGVGAYEVQPWIAVPDGQTLPGAAITAVVAAFADISTWYLANQGHGFSILPPVVYQSPLTNAGIFAAYNDPGNEGIWHGLQAEAQAASAINVDDYRRLHVLIPFAIEMHLDFGAIGSTDEARDFGAHFDLPGVVAIDHESAFSLMGLDATDYGFAPSPWSSDDAEGFVAHELGHAFGNGVDIALAHESAITYPDNLMAGGWFGLTTPPTLEQFQIDLLAKSPFLGGGPVAYTVPTVTRIRNRADETSVSTTINDTVEIVAGLVEVADIDDHGLILLEVASPGTPDAGYVRVYPKSDGKLYIKDDAGVETDLTGGVALTYMLSLWFDPTNASTTVSKGTIGPLPFAGTFVKATIKCADGETNGATAQLVDIHKQTAANENTDTSTTVFTTQSNRPTITNTNKAGNTTAFDVTTFAKGDYLRIFSDQAGTTLTSLLIGIEVTTP